MYRQYFKIFESSEDKIPHIVPHIVPKDELQTECILIIDPQKDFHENGSLAVLNADADAQRIANFLKERPEMKAFVTMDTHDNRHHIFLADSWKVVGDKEHPPPFTVITYVDNKFVANCVLPNSLFKNKIVEPLENVERQRYSKKTWKNHCIDYCLGLAVKNRPSLIIWPKHCVKGTDGYAIVEIINNQLDNKQRIVEKITKGESHETENYSVFQAEMRIDANKSTLFNTELFDKLHTYDTIYVCGQAKSHCVNYSIRDLVDNGFPAAKLVLLENCMSPVATYENTGNNFIVDMKKRGAKIATVNQDEICFQ